MRSHNQDGYWILCGGIIPAHLVKVGQKWLSAKNPVTITAIDEINKWVTYEGQGQPEIEKDNFSFQCHYCLILDSAEVPMEYRHV
jgi:hypothetical protein